MDPVHSLGLNLGEYVEHHCGQCIAHIYTLYGSFLEDHRYMLMYIIKFIATLYVTQHAYPDDFFLNLNHIKEKKCIMKRHKGHGQTPKESVLKEKTEQVMEIQF